MKHKGKDEIRIVDFGSARILKSKQEKLTTFSGAEVIRAPEITKKNKPYPSELETNLKSIYKNK